MFGELRVGFLELLHSVSQQRAGRYFPYDTPLFHDCRIRWETRVRILLLGVAERRHVACELKTNHHTGTPRTSPSGLLIPLRDIAGPR